MEKIVKEFLNQLENNKSILEKKRLEKVLEETEIVFLIEEFRKAMKIDDFEKALAIKKSIQSDEIYVKYKVLELELIDELLYLRQELERLFKKEMLK